MSRLAYLASPIDQAGSAPQGWTEHCVVVEAALTAHGFDVYRPDRAFGHAFGASVQRANTAVLGQAGAGVVLLPAGVPTLGCPVEIEQMLQRKIPVMIVTDIVGSVQLRSWEERGAQIHVPEGIRQGVKELLASIPERTPMQEAGDKFRQLAAEMRARQPLLRPLTFEPVDLTSRGQVLTPSGPVHILPTRGYSDDAGLDLYVSRDVEIGPDQFVDVPTGVKVDVPDHHWAMITGRSSTLRKRGLLVNTGVIDAGWTGELFAGVKNLTAQTVQVPAGERLAQLILLPAPITRYEPEWGRVRTKERGENGFGSTGA